MVLTQAEIRATLDEMTLRNRALTDKLTDKVSLTDYAHLVREGNIWTDALQTALNDHEIIVIPASAEPYMIDASVTIPSNRRIEAHGAIIRMCKGVRVLMLRNEHILDGTHAPIPSDDRDENITILGGSWEESNTQRIDISESGLYDNERSIFGVSALMLFDNLNHLTIKDCSFAHTATFAIQIGDIADVHCENISFIECYADGLHANGNVENLLARNLYGYTEDDLVALNMYDWQKSSINFGPMKTVLCEDIKCTGGCRALRILPGIYEYDDGSTVDCSLTDAILSRIEGIREYKMYLQTPPYVIGTEPEKGDVGSVDNVFFEHLSFPFPSDPSPLLVAPLEINAHVGRITLEDIAIDTTEGTPLKALIAVGPKSFVMDGSEWFNPYLSCDVDTIVLKNIRINGSQPEDIRPLIREIVFDRLYEGGPSTGRGTIRTIGYERI